MDGATTVATVSQLPVTLRGRDPEIARVDRLVRGGEDAERGLVVVGEPGIGKSTLWAHGVAGARAGVRVVATTCVEAEREMPYAALEALFADLLDDHGAVLPAPQREALDGAFLRASTVIPTDPRTVAAGVLSLLRSALDAGPLLLAVDDLHWVDVETHVCLTYALRRLDHPRLTLLLAGRDRSPLWNPRHGPGHDPVTTLVQSAPEDTVHTLRLGPLSDVAVGQMIADRWGSAPSAQECRDLVAETGGNPFWTLQLGGREPDTAAGPRPAGLDALVTGRIAHLDRDTVDAACLVAALGRPTPAALLPVLAPPGTDAAADAADDDDADDARGEWILDQAVAAGLVAVRGGRLVPAHPMIGTALLAKLPPFRRRRLYRQAADLADSAEARALHLLKALGDDDVVDDDPADPGSGRALLLDALDEAAAAARQRGAAETAAHFAARALAVVEGDAPRPPAPGTRRVAVAELQYQAGDLDAVLRTLEPIDLAALDADLLERVAPLWVQAINDRRGGAAARTAVDGLADLPRDGLDATALARRRALISTLRVDQRCGAAGDRRDGARRAVEQTGAAPVRAELRRRALGALAYALLDAGELADEALDRLDALGAPETTEPGRWGDREHLEGMNRWAAVDIVGARKAFATAFERHLATGDAPAIAYTGAQLGLLDIVSGCPSAAEATLDRIEDHVGHSSVERLHVAHVRGFVHSLRGDDEALEATIAVLARHGDRSAPGVAGVDVLRALLALQRGEPRQAVECLDRYMALAERYQLFDFHYGVWALGLVGQASLALGDFARAQDAADRMAERIAASTFPADAVGLRVMRGQYHRHLADVAARRDLDLDRAVALARDAVALHEDCPFPSEYAVSLGTLAGVHALRGEPDAATEHGRRAQAVFAAIGYAWAPARTPDPADPADPAPEAAAASASVSSSGAPSAFSVLSPSERAVAEIVAAGETNRAAAATLHLSVRTVENHLRTIYRKLGIRSRGELSAHLDG